MRICPECGNKSLMCIAHKGEVVCKNCGLVIDDFGIEEDPYISHGNRCNAEVPILIKASSAPINGRIVKNQWLLSTREKNLKIAEDRILLIASKLRLTESITREARIILKIAIDKNLNVGRDNISLAYASIYASCLIHKVPKTPLEITAYSEITRTKMLRTYVLLRQKLNLNIHHADALDYLPRFSSRLGLSHETIREAGEILVRIKGKPVTYGKHPETLVASAIYLATLKTGDERTQRDIANATGVIEVTIRKRSKEIIKELSI